MTESDKNTDRLEALFFEVKKYVELQSDLAKLDFTEKLSIIFSRAILVIIFAILGLLILLTCSFMLVYVLNNYFQDLVLSFGILCAAFVLIALIVYWKHDQLITRHVVNFLGKLFLDKDERLKK